MASNVKELIANLKETIACLEKMEPELPVTAAYVFKSMDGRETDDFFSVTDTEIYVTQDEEEDFIEFGVMLTC